MLCERTKCVGCGSCAQTCAKNAISMKPDKNGFLYPEIDKKLCVSCGECSKACPVLEKPKMIEKSPKVVASFAMDAALRESSTSGGVFTLIAEKILSDGGAVFGAVFNPDFTVKHCETTEKSGVSAMRGSKYVQSDINSCYIDCRETLKCGKPVLFSGTPCQIAGLYKFLGGDNPNLITCDIMCHGAPSPAFWQKYLSFLERKHGSKVTQVAFRSKRTGWHCSSVEFTFRNGKKHSRMKDRDPFMRAFLRDYIIRQSCFDCTFAGSKRMGDITLGDFWGYHEKNPLYRDDDKGISLVILNSLKGERLFATVRGKAKCLEKSMREAIPGNKTLTKGTSRPSDYDEFWKDYETLSFDELQKKYLAPEKGSIVKRLLWTKPGIKLRSLIKR